MFTGSQAFGDGSVRLLNVPAIIAVDINGLAGRGAFVLTSLSSEVLSYVTDTSPGGTIAPGKTVSLPAGNDAEIVQLLPASSGKAVTLTLSLLPAVQSGAAQTALAQALVGGAR